MDRSKNTIKNRSDDRILVLKVEEGKKPLNNLGAADPRLFNGTNRLHAKLDKMYGMWYLEYDNGQLPNPLVQKFTSFQKLLDFTTGYFKRRNVDIVEVIDYAA